MPTGANLYYRRIVTARRAIQAFGGVKAIAMGGEELLHRFGHVAAKVVGGTALAIRGRPGVFAAAATGVFALNLALPLIVLSLTRKPWEYFTVNPWLSRLPAYLASSEASIPQKLAFLSNLALFWFTADSPYGGVEWGFAVSLSDLLRFAFMSFIFGAYFALWSYSRDRTMGCGSVPRTAGYGGIAGALASLLGFSIGPCSVMGCGAPVIPVIGLAFVGLSSGTLRVLADLSRVGTWVVLLAMTVSLALFGSACKHQT